LTLGHFGSDISYPIASRGWGTVVGRSIASTVSFPASVHAFFFEGAPHVPGQPEGIGVAPSPNYVTDFLASSDGLALTKAFTRIKEPKLRRSIVNLVEEIAGDDDA
jgi:hypothetical protein